MKTLSKAIFFLTIFFILNLLESSKVFGILPPEFYEREVQESSIKAIAVVEEVKVLSETTQSSQKNVLFNLERSFHKDTPQKFTGTCYSVDHKWQTPTIGGTIHYYPRKKDRALVTISRDSGTITSYTKLTPELEKELNENGLNNISFQMGRALIKNKNSGREFVKIGRWYYKSKQYKAAFWHFKKAASMGNASGFYNLGLLYTNGQGVDKDMEKAKEYYKKAAELGDKDAIKKLSDRSQE